MLASNLYGISSLSNCSTTLAASDELKAFVGLCLFSNRLLFTKYGEPDIYVYNPDIKLTSKYESIWHFSVMRFLLKVNTSLFITAYQYVLKFDLISGKKNFSVSLSETIGNNNAMSLGLCALERDGQHKLFVTTEGYSGIHYFEI